MLNNQPHRVKVKLIKYRHSLVVSKDVVHVAHRQTPCVTRFLTCSAVVGGAEMMGVIFTRGVTTEDTFLSLNPILVFLVFYWLGHNASYSGLSAFTGHIAEIPNLTDIPILYAS